MVLKRYYVVENEIIPKLTFFLYKTLYIMFLCVEFFKKYLDIHVIYKGLVKWALVRKKADISFHLCKLTPMCHNILYFGKLVYFIKILKSKKTTTA